MSENKLSQNLSLNFNELLKASIRLPVVKIDRDTFLRTELEKRYDDETICRAIEYNPAYANIPAAEIDLLAAESIKAETLRVSAISFAAGLPDLQCSAAGRGTASTGASQRSQRHR